RKVSRRIASVVERALAPAPADRPRSAAAFASELRVAAEGSGKLLREAISLYSERFPIFLRISLLAYAPLIAMVAVLFLSDVIPFLAEKAEQYMTVLAIILLPGSLIASLFAFALASALAVPVVVQTTIAPLRPVSVRAAVLAVRRRRGAFAIASVTALGII